MTEFETLGGRSIPAVTADEMREVDRVAVQETGPELLQMMENAGRNLASRALAFGDDSLPDAVVVLAGGGGNGGGGLCAARHCHDHGVDVRVILDRDPADLSGAPATQRRILDATPVPVSGPGAITDGEAPIAGEELVLDAVLGYGLADAPRGPARALIAAAGDGRAVVSLDVPSGVDATTGERPGVAVDPDETVTLALPKTGLPAVGDGDRRLFVADIGIPPAVFERAGIDYRSPFAGTGAYLVELRSRGHD